MNLSAPTHLFFLISLVLAVLAVVLALNIVHIAAVPAVWIAVAAWAVLAVGCMIRGA